ncbi:MAG: LruC domain-containing protein [Lentimicrobium sp.]
MIRSNRLLLTGIFAFSLGVVSCTKDLTPENPGNSAKFEDLIIADDFNFETTAEKTFTISAHDNLNSPIKGVRFDIYTAHPDSGGILMTSGGTNSEGVFSGKINLPGYLEHVVITTRFLGFPFEKYVEVDENIFSAAYGGGQKSLNKKSSANGFKSFLKSTAGAPLNFMGTFNGLGVPDYLEPANDPIGQDLLNDVNASLPEKRPVPQFNPDYLDTQNQTSLTITQESDVWVTFVHEGAGYKNVLGFYTYDVNNPPATVNNISAINVIYPNVSFQGSGGGLVSGNKVLIGRFPADTKIGWALLQNAYNGTVNPNATTFFSDSWLNPESNSNLKQHTVQLLDPGRNIVLMGFEDMRRDNGSDNDFNDAIFYVTANPVEAIQYTSMPLITYLNPDTDNDGVPDNFDEFPTDPARAFISYFPGKSTYGTLAYEDLWPATGDYDFNDLVVRYKFTQITNGSNEVVQINTSFIPEAVGANLNAGFGFQLDNTMSAAVESVTGMHLTEDYIALGPNGTEAGQSKAVFIAFDKAFTVLNNITGENPSGMAPVNTVPGGRIGTPDTVALEINFSSPVNSSVTGLAPYNPFIFVNYQRGHEIHLPDNIPTDMVDESYFGTRNDNSNPNTGRYYKSVDNLPWAMNVVDSYDYTIEEAQVNSAFIYFGTWATSSGTQNKDWFKNMNGYRDNNKIYSHY